MAPFKGPSAPTRVAGAGARVLRTLDLPKHFQLKIPLDGGTVLAYAKKVYTDSRFVVIHRLCPGFKVVVSALDRSIRAFVAWLLVRFRWWSRKRLLQRLRRSGRKLVRFIGKRIRWVCCVLPGIVRRWITITYYASWEVQYAADKVVSRDVGLYLRDLGNYSLELLYLLRIVTYVIGVLWAFLAYVVFVIILDGDPEYWSSAPEQPKKRPGMELSTAPREHWFDETDAHSFRGIDGRILDLTSYDVRDEFDFSD